MKPNETILIARGMSIEEKPRAEWERELAHAPEAISPRLGFMQADHHAVRRFVVSELPRRGRAITPEEIADALSLERSRVATIIDELEKALFFVVRTEGTAVSWAFPVTVEKTPHELAFSSGERCFAAWAEDAIAAPFVEGRLRQQPLTIEIRTQCGHCDRAMTLSIDSELQARVAEPDAQPLVFEPSVDWSTFREPNIIHHY